MSIAAHNGLMTIAGESELSDWQQRPLLFQMEQKIVKTSSGLV